jgi:hypothetical protein
MAASIPVSASKVRTQGKPSQTSTQTNRKIYARFQTQGKKSPGNSNPNDLYAMYKQYQQGPGELQQSGEHGFRYEFVYYESRSLVVDALATLQRYLTAICLQLLTCFCYWSWWKLLTLFVYCTLVYKLWSIFLVLSIGYVEQKLLGRSRKSLVFLKSNFFGSENFQVSAHVLPK